MRKKILINKELPYFLLLLIRNSKEGLKIWLAAIARQLTLTYFGGEFYFEILNFKKNAIPIFSWNQNSISISGSGQIEFFSSNCHTPLYVNDLFRFCARFFFSPPLSTFFSFFLFTFTQTSNILPESPKSEFKGPFFRFILF